MFSLTAEVCDTEDAGTDNAVYVTCERFDGEYCFTDILGEWDTDDWEQGSTRTWDKDWLDNNDDWPGNPYKPCTKFTPIKSLKCRFVLELGAWNLLPIYDRSSLKICKLTVVFGSRILPRRRTVWEWSGEREFSLPFSVKPGGRNEFENWIEMQRRQP